MTTDRYGAMAQELLASPGVNRGVGGAAIGTPFNPSMADIGQAPGAVARPGPVIASGSAPVDFATALAGGGRGGNGQTPPLLAQGLPRPDVDAARNWMTTAQGRDAVRSSIDSIIQRKRLGIPPADNAATYQELIQNLLAQFRGKQQGVQPLGDLFTNGSGNTSALM